MRNLIKKILREDFDWTNQAEPYKLGDFDEDDVSFDDKGAKVYLGKDGEVTYNLSVDEFVEYAYDGYEDWTLNTLIQSNGDYDDYYDDGYLDDDEINYMGGYLTEIQLERLQKILNHYGVELSRGARKYKDVNDVISDDNFSMLEGPMGRIYTGRHDWDDFTGESMSALNRAINSNRWRVAGEQYLKVLADNKVDVTSYSHDDVQVVMAFPYKGNNNLSEALADIGLDDHSWSDSFYDEWDPSDANEEIKQSFSQMLDTIEEKIDEETNS
jgi:hypothetical protein